MKPRLRPANIFDWLVFRAKITPRVRRGATILQGSLSTRSLARFILTAVNLTEMKSRILLASLLFVVWGVSVSAQRKPTPSANSLRSLTIVTEPSAIVWLDEIRRGSTNTTGQLALAKVSAGAHSLRVRASGFKEVTMSVSAAQRGEVRVRLVRTTDEAELTFQQAETVRETAKDDQLRQQSADLYRQALRLRSAFPAAHVGLARVLMDLNDSSGALLEIESARRDKPVYPEASAAEGRIFRETGQTDEAIGSFNRAIRESHGFQPEAHVGLGRVYEDRGEYELAAREYEISIKQLSDTEPIIYQLLGAAYEKTGQNKEAVVAYDNYLRLAPNGSLAPAVRSILEQLREQPLN